VSRLPREAREGMMRAWLEILRDRHPGVSWVPIEQAASEGDGASPDEVEARPVATPATAVAA
jgi:hypothetical protein